MQLINIIILSLGLSASAIPVPGDDHSVSHNGGNKGGKNDNYGDHGKNGDYGHDNDRGNNGNHGKNGGNKGYGGVSHSYRDDKYDNYGWNKGYGGDNKGYGGDYKNDDYGNSHGYARQLDSTTQTNKSQREDAASSLAATPIQRRRRISHPI
ncbi:hypothetical protein H4I95_06186 [Botrytis cinerea]